jgi:hypothetical protein
MVSLGKLAREINENEDGFEKDFYVCLLFVQITM